MADYVLKEIRKMVIYDPNTGQPIYVSMYEHLSDPDFLFASIEEMEEISKDLERRQAEEKIIRGIGGQQLPDKGWEYE